MDETYVSGEPGAFTLELRMDGLKSEPREALRVAADRWTRLVIGPKPPQQVVDGRTAGGLVIIVSTSLIDGASGTLAESRVSSRWPASAGTLAGLPCTVKVVFDSKDLGWLAKSGRLEQVAAHEIGHALGFGVSWLDRKLLKKVGGRYAFMGLAAMKEYGELLGQDSTPVPAHRGSGSHGPHWHEDTFGGELMSPTYEKGDGTISSVTLASLRDLGYVVKVEAADPFVLR